MRRARFAILALLLLLGGSLACLLLLDEEGPAPEEELPRAGVELAGPARAGVAAEAATKRAAESSAASSAASSSTPMAPRALVPSPSAPSGPTPPGAQEESEFVGEVQLSIYAGEQLFLEPADVQLEATFGGQPCRVELAQAPERALQAHLEVRWSGAARSPRLVVRAWLRQDPRRRDVFVTSLVENHRIDSLLDLQLRHELTVRCDRPLTEGEVQAHLLDHRGESRRSWDVELGEGGPSSVATFSGLPPGDYRLLALGQGSEGGRRVGQGRVRLAKGRPGLV
ncbi:MAG TPA: hypothetical protein DEA08_31055, partial [Planctomycetes bacterium]|nr:hypothetical protein [Planctomycetota bacterium]